MKRFVAGLLFYLLTTGAFGDGDALFKQGAALFKFDPAKAYPLFVRAAEEGNVSAIMRSSFWRVPIARNRQFLETGRRMEEAENLYKADTGKRKRGYQQQLKRRGKDQLCDVSAQIEPFRTIYIRFGCFFDMIEGTKRKLDLKPRPSR